MGNCLREEEPIFSLFCARSSCSRSLSLCPRMCMHRWREQRRDGEEKYHHSYFYLYVTIPLSPSPKTHHRYYFLSIVPNGGVYTHHTIVMCVCAYVCVRVFFLSVSLRVWAVRGETEKTLKPPHPHQHPHKHPHPQQVVCTIPMIVNYLLPHTITFLMIINYLCPHNISFNPFSSYTNAQSLLLSLSRARALSHNADANRTGVRPRGAVSYE